MATPDLDWHPPSTSWITDLSSIVNGTGVHGFIFNSSTIPSNVPYGTYNWCNMPHVRTDEYVVPDSAYQLQYVEVVPLGGAGVLRLQSPISVPEEVPASRGAKTKQIHRHHKRTPYASNTFPQESYPWDCSNQGLFYYGEALNPKEHDAASTYWEVYTSESNPLAPAGFNGTCQFPQISRGGLADSWQHGKDLYGVYHDLLGFLPAKADESVSFRVTNNVITSQVAGMVVGSMYPSEAYPLKIQPSSIDSLEPAYTCATATSLSGNYSVGSDNAEWTLHLNMSQPLFAALDAVSNVPVDDEGFHRSWDHYYDNLSARQCHEKPLPCNISNPSLCVSQEQADAVFRLGQHEYSYIYRNAPESLEFATASYGIWAAELAQSIRDVMAGTSRMKYRHNIAHDGSISRLLSILQVDIMVWPGMGAEIVFELYSKGHDDSKHFLRVLWGGKVLKSSNPSLGVMDMIEADMFLAYIDGLVGSKAVKVPELCAPV